MLDGLVVDLFAGGGGASAGIEAALGRSVDIAINHDAVALAVHKANHPQTLHVEEDIWKANPGELVKGRRVALLWASPDCTHFSTAKGGKPRKKKLRTLAWAVYRWARATSPAVIFIENVREFEGWGPLTKEDKPDKRYIGKTFRFWVRRIERLGYVVEHRMLDASLYGAPTRRRRLFIVARRDGKPIIWPEFTHGPGRLPLRTAAECIDWSLACPSIFERKKPLADKTQWRIAQGVKRFVLENPRPFIVGVGGRAGQSDPTAADAPVGTITAKNDRALVAPHLIKVNHGDDAKTGPREHSLEKPLGTVTAGGNGHALIAPALIKVNHGGDEPRGEAIDRPLTTVTAQRRGHALIAPTLVQTGYGEREGQLARVPGLDKPLGTVVAQGQKHSLVSAFLSKHYTGVVGQQLNLGIGTITSRDHHSLTAAHLLKFRGQCHGAGMDEPMPTLSAQGMHVAEVHAFLVKYYGTARAGRQLDLPMPTLTSKHRLGLVLVEGVAYEIADIGMRMLQPRELFRAQGFHDGYIIDRDVDGNPFTKTAQVRMCGNSVCPPLAAAIVAAQFAVADEEKAA